MMQRRTMKVSGGYEIQERYGEGNWAPICQCDTLDEAKETLKNIRLLENEDRTE